MTIDFPKTIIRNHKRYRTYVSPDSKVVWDKEEANEIVKEIKKGGGSAFTHKVFSDMEIFAVYFRRNNGN